MRVDRRNLLYPILYLVILAGANALHLVPPHILSYQMIHLLQYMIYVLLILGWATTVSARLYHPQIRIYHGLLIVCFMLELFFRGMRHIVFMGILPWERIFWYWYYVPELAIPMISYFMTQYIGRKEGYRIDKRIFLVLIPYALLSIGILTNDHHGLAFIIDKTASSLARDHRVSYLYVVAQVWLFFFAVLSIIRLYRVCKAAGLKAYVWPPALIVLFGAAYMVLYTLNRSTMGVGFIEARAMFFTITIGVWESCLSMGLVPNNRFYDRFFDASDIPMEILDDKGNVRFISAGERAGIAKDTDRAFRTREYPIPGGSVRWQEEITDNLRVAKQLEKANAELDGANKRLARQARVKLDTTRAEARTRLYDSALLAVERQLSMVEERLKACRTLTGEARRDMLASLCVPASYIKRRSNLILISEATQSLPVQELHFCLREIHEALALIPIGTHYESDIASAVNVPTRFIMEVYDALEALVEEHLPEMEQFSLTLTADETKTEISAWMSGEHLERIERRWAL